MRKNDDFLGRWVPVCSGEKELVQKAGSLPVVGIRSLDLLNLHKFITHIYCNIVGGIEGEI
jgi:hypothetical protein